MSAQDQHRVLITRPLPEQAEGVLRAAGLAVDALNVSGGPAKADLLSRARGVSGILATLGEKVDPELLDAAGPTLRVVANFAVGFENIDLAACAARGVIATNTPDVLTEAVADLTWALILAAARRVIEGDGMVRRGEWKGWTPTQLMGVELFKSTLGIVGAGRIGSAVARRASGFRMQIVYAGSRNQQLEKELQARQVSLEELLAQSDIVSLHCPMRPENHHLLSAQRLTQMKPSAILINTARGALIDEAALVTALKNRQIAAAGLDVFEREPALAPGLAELSNVVLLPHIGSATHATRGRMAELAAENIVRVLAGRPALTPIPLR